MRPDWRQGKTAELGIGPAYGELGAQEGAQSDRDDRLRGVLAPGE